MAEAPTTTTEKEEVFSTADDAPSPVDLGIERMLGVDADPELVVLEEAASPAPAVQVAAVEEAVVVVRPAEPAPAEAVKEVPAAEPPFLPDPVRSASPQCARVPSYLRPTAAHTARTSKQVREP